MLGTEMMTMMSFFCRNALRKADPDYLVCVCTCETDNNGHVIDLVKDELPEMQLSEEDRKKNLELLDEAKKVSDRFLTRRGRRSTCSLTDSPTGNSNDPNTTSFTHISSQLGQKFTAWLGEIEKTVMLI